MTKRFFENDDDELKFHDVIVNVNDISSDGQIGKDSVNLIAQGTSESQRIGRKVTLKHIAYRYSYHMDRKQDQTSIVNGQVVRLILYIDKQANGATAAVTDILEEATDNYLSFLNLANKGRFVILMDRSHDLNYYTMTVIDNAGVPNYSSQKIIKIADEFQTDLDLPINFNSTAGAITEITSNNIGLLFTSTDFNTLDIESRVRIRFTDD